MAPWNFKEGQKARTDDPENQGNKAELQEFARRSTVSVMLAEIPVLQ